jgi:hypothetical protein
MSKEWNHLIQIQLDTVRIPVTIPLYLSSDEPGERSLVHLVKLFGDQTMRIYNAMVTAQRILFVGHNHAAGMLSPSF